MEHYPPKEQAGFRPGYGTNEHLQVLNRKLFVDFQKAFDTVEFDATSTPTAD